SAPSTRARVSRAERGGPCAERRGTSDSTAEGAPEGRDEGKLSATGAVVERRDGGVPEGARARLIHRRKQDELAIFTVEPLLLECERWRPSVRPIHACASHLVERACRVAEAHAVKRATERPIGGAELSRQRAPHVSLHDVHQRRARVWRQHVPREPVLEVEDLPEDRPVVLPVPAPAAAGTLALAADALRVVGILADEVAGLGALI